MKRFLVGCAVVAMASAACCAGHEAKVAQLAPPPPPSKKYLPEELERQTVALDHWMGVVGKDEDGDPVRAEVEPGTEGAQLGPYCGGVWVSKDKILTAWHCIEDIGQPEMTPQQLMMSMMLGKDARPTWNPIGQFGTVTYWGDYLRGGDGTKTHKFKIVAGTKEEDLALLQVGDASDPVPEHPIVELTPTRPHVGETVHIVGHTVGYWWTYSRGYVSQLRPKLPNFDGNPVDVIQLSAPVWRGNSGGGIWNDDGQFLGIASWISTEGPMISFAIDAHTCWRFLHKNDVF